MSMCSEFILDHISLKYQKLFSEFTYSLQRSLPGREIFQKMFEKYAKNVILYIDSLIEMSYTILVCLH